MRAWPAHFPACVQCGALAGMVAYASKGLCDSCYHGRTKGPKPTTFVVVNPKKKGSCGYEDREDGACVMLDPLGMPL